jgi:multimeric flavodoxin WrbA
MKIIALNGSPRKGLSRTGQIVGEILAGAQSAGAQTEYIDITTLAIGGCIGCDRCHHVGVCVQRDDFNGLFDKMCASDGIVLGSPVYIYQVTAQLKAFIDRAWACHPLPGAARQVWRRGGHRGRVRAG